MVVKSKFSPKKLPKRELGGLTGDPNKEKVAQLQALLPQVPPNYKQEPWIDPERRWFGGATNFSDPRLNGEDLFINDAGALQIRPDRTKKKLTQLQKLAMPIAMQQSTTSVDSSTAKNKLIIDMANSF
jgi:hypothetical protein